MLLAAVTAAVTRTVQLAQVATMPALWLPLVFSGLLFPLAMLPEPLRWVAEALPLTPVAELLRLALRPELLPPAVTASGWPRPSARPSSGARAHRLDRGGRVGGRRWSAGNRGLGTRDTLEG